MARGEKEPLYRKENKVSLKTKYYVNKGGDFRHQRNTKEFEQFEGNKLSMKKLKLGYDYTPLFRFLLSKVGKEWKEIFSEAKSRLNQEDPIFWMVALQGEETPHEIVRLSEHSYWSKLFVDSDGILRKVNAEEKAPEPSCTCCTHSFNGKAIKPNPIKNEI